MKVQIYNILPKNATFFRFILQYIHYKLFAKDASPASHHQTGPIPPAALGKIQSSPTLCEG